MTTKRYSYRAYPTRAQQEHLARVFGCVRVAYNDAVAYRKAAFAEGRKVTRGETSANLTASKKTEEREWLREVSCVPLQQAVRQAESAYSNFFSSLSGKRKGRKVGAPRFKKRSARQTAKYTKNAAFKVRQTPHGVGFLRLPGVGQLRFNLSRPLPSDPSSLTVIKEADGTYHITFVVEVPSKDLLPETTNVIGIDLGLTHLAITASSDGSRTKIPNPRHLREAERRLKSAQRRYSRKQKGSKNQEKARISLAKHHSKVRRTRIDHHRKLALQLVRENQTIALESLSIAGLARTRLAKSISDAGWGLLIRCINEKAVEYGRTVIPISQWEPTSQVCSICGVKDGKKPLSVRIWTCSSCGITLDRDYNAAVNILLAAGLAESLNACGGNVRLRQASADPDEARTHLTTQVG